MQTRDNFFAGLNGFFGVISLSGYHVVFSILILFLTSTFPAMGAQTITQDGLDKLDQAIRAAQTELDIPAVAWLITDAGKMIHLSVSGVRDRQTRAPVSDQSIFRIGSITKLVTALAVSALQEESKISLDDNLRDLTPRMPLTNPWRDTHPVKVIHLLEHTAGLKELTGEEFNHTEPKSLNDALWWRADKRRTHWPPGKHHAYRKL